MLSQPIMQTAEYMQNYTLANINVVVIIIWSQMNCTTLNYTSNVHSCTYCLTYHQRVQITYDDLQVVLASACLSLAIIRIDYYLIIQQKCCCTNTSSIKLQKVESIQLKMHKRYLVTHIQYFQPIQQKTTHQIHINPSALMSQPSKSSYTRNSLYIQ